MTFDDYLGLFLLSASFLYFVLSYSKIKANLENLLNKQD